SRPVRRKGKKGEKLHAVLNIFGTVSTYGSAMTRELREHLLFKFKLRTFTHLRGWMRNQYAVNNELPVWELAARNNSMCQLNDAADLRDMLEAQITVTDRGNGTIAINIPSINPLKNIKAPVRTTKVNLKMLATCSPFKGSQYISGFAGENFSFNYSNSEITFPEFILDTKGKLSDIAIVVIAMEFETTNAEGKFNTEPKWLPAGVIAMGRLH
ncbi:MAG TPA: hypothetical protein VK498_04150, partial [Ferruginibacter sp.]|nr:hypothetical protein [Ferruginibacter sp.]